MQLVDNNVILLIVLNFLHNLNVLPGVLYRQNRYITKMSNIVQNYILAHCKYTLFATESGCIQFKKGHNKSTFLRSNQIRVIVGKYIQRPSGGQCFNSLHKLIN